MAKLTKTAVLIALWLVAGVFAPLSAAIGEEMPLGEASLALPPQWQVTGHQPDAELALSGPARESLRVFWWFPDEPLLGYDDQISHETRSFPAGPALVIRSRMADRSVVQVAFEHENRDRQRLLFVIESETLSPGDLEASLEPMLQGLRFAGDGAVEVAALTPVQTVDPASVAVDFDRIVDSLSPAHGGDCRRVAVDGLPGYPAMGGLSLAPEAAAHCPLTGTTIVAVTLPQDPRQGQAGPLGRAYMRVFMAQGRAPLLLVDQAHAALVSLMPEGAAGLAVALSDLAAPADTGAAEPAQDGRAALFPGRMDAAWLPHALRGGNFEDWARFDGGMLSVTVTSPPEAGTTGIRSAAPMVRLPAPGDTSSLRLQFDFDTATTNNAVFALVPPDQAGKPDWDAHEIWVAVEQKRDAGPELVLAVQRRVQARYPISDREVLRGLTLELRPDGLLLLSNAAGLVLIEGQMAAVPLATDLHLQVSASSPGAKVSARLDLRRIELHPEPFDPASDPGRLLGDAPQELVLFDGRARGLHLDLHGVAGQDLTGKLWVDDGLKVVSPKGDGLTGLGLYSPEPVLWLDRFTTGASARLRFEFDPAATDGFRLALATPYGKSHMEPGFPRFVLDWHRMADGTITASRWIDRELDRLDAAPSAMPAVVELLVTPGGVQVLADGFPDDILPWDALQEGQGFRLFALAKAENAAAPVALALRRITLLRTPGTDRPPAPQPMPGVDPLPVTRHFPDPAAPWEPFALAGLSFEEAGRFGPDGAVVVDVEPKYERGRAGILSPAPVAVLDERMAQTAYRLTLGFDPERTDGLQVILSGSRTADMWKGSEVGLSLVRDTTGREAGSHVLTLTRDYYAYWHRRLSAQDMARWNGTMILDLAPGTLTVTLPDIVSHRGTGFVGIAKGAEFYMVVQSLSDLPYGAARMALQSLDGQWVMPDGMTALQRPLLLDPASFDPEAYLDAMIDELIEEGP